MMEDMVMTMDPLDTPYVDEEDGSPKTPFSNSSRQFNRARISSSAPSDERRSAQNSMSPTKTRPVVEIASPSKPSPSKRPQRKRKPDVSYKEEEDETNEAAIAEGMRPLTLEERQDWKGWVELESDPMIFNYILREYGVKDIKIQEVFSLDDMELASLPQPVHGLIFLFRYRDEDAEDNAEDMPKCPKHVWFANQTTHNACATVAMMNTVMNAPDVELGEVLTQFKKETKQLKPAYRGKSLSENKFIRTIHNSFARKMDVLNSDLHLDNEFEKWEKSLKNPKRKKTSNTSSRLKKKVADNEDLAYHFIAFVPIEGEVWRFDGLQRQPLCIGPTNSNWLSVARESIQIHISLHEEDGVQFNLLSLCRSPLLSLPPLIASTTQSLLATEERLSAISPTWRTSLPSPLPPSTTDPDPEHGLTPEIMTKSRLTKEAEWQIDEAGLEVPDLVRVYEGFVREWKQLRGEYRGERFAIEDERGEMGRRMGDYTGVVFEAVKTLDEAGVLRDIVHDLAKGGGV